MVKRQKTYKFSKNVIQKLENIIFNKMWITCFKLTLLLGAFGALSGGLVIGPLTHKPYAFEIEKGTCIPSYFRYTEDFRRYVRFEKDKKGERKGKVSSQYRDKPLDNAINRAIDEHSAWNFNGGYLMKNSVLDSIGARHWSGSPDGYSIVTAGWEKFYHCKSIGIVLAIVGFLLPIAFIVGASILYLIIWGPGACIYRASSRWLKWTFSEFFR